MICRSITSADHFFTFTAQHNTYEILLDPVHGYFFVFCLSAGCKQWANRHCTIQSSECNTFRFSAYHTED